MKQKIVRMGRIATGVMVLIALAWIPVVKGAHDLYNYLQSVQGYLAPPISVVGVFRMLADTPCTLNPNFHYREGSMFWIVNCINFQYFNILITIVSALVMVGVSYLTSPPNEAQIKSLTFATASADAKAQTRASLGASEVVASLVVIAFILGAYVYFRG